MAPWEGRAPEAWFIGGASVITFYHTSPAVVHFRTRIRRFPPMATSEDQGSGASLEELIKAAQAGDGQAQGELLERNIPQLTAFVRLKSGAELRARESSTDIVQSTCREVLGDLAHFEYRGEASFRAWLCQVAYNKIIQKVRFYQAERRNPRRETPEALSACYAQAFSPSQLAVGNETAERIEHAFDRLSAEQREVLLLTRVAGLSAPQIAEQLGLRAEAVRSRRSRALVKLAEHLAD